MTPETSTLIGVLFEIFVADFFTVLGLSGQKLAINQTNNATPVGASNTISNPKWVAYFCCFLFGQAIEAFSLSMASQTDIAAVSNLTLVWSAVFSYLWFDEQFNFLPPLRVRKSLNRLKKQFSFSQINASEDCKDGNIGSSPNGNKKGETLSTCSTESFGNERISKKFNTSKNKTISSDYGTNFKSKVNESKREDAVESGDGFRSFGLCNYFCFDGLIDSLIGWDLLNYTLLILGSILTVLSSPAQINADSTTAASLLRDWAQFPYNIFGICLLLAVVSSVVYLINNWRRNLANKNILALVTANLAAMLSALTLTLSKMFLTLIKELIDNANKNDAEKSANVLTIDSIEAFSMSKASKLAFNVGNEVKDAIGKGLMIFLYILLVILWISLIISGIYVLNLGLARFQQRVIVPIYEISGTIITILSSILFYKTYTEFTPTSFSVFSTGIVLMCTGIYLVSLRETKTEAEVSGDEPHNIKTTHLEEVGLLNSPNAHSGLLENEF